ncbi:hypothetical protein vseg_001117 [Gypsophila vaccaria]
MGWTLFACFGSTTNERKRPRSSKLGPKRRVKRIQGYHRLQNDVKIESEEELREKPKDEKKPRIKKKVRFNLDVIVYEPIISNYDTNSSQENMYENYMEDQSKGVESSFPASYRYSRFYGDENDYEDNEDEDEDGEYELSDLEEDDDGVVSGGEMDEHSRGLSCRPLISSADKNLRMSNDKMTYGRSRRHYAVSVLNPIDNLSQWKAIKSRKL